MCCPTPKDPGAVSATGRSNLGAMLRGAFLRSRWDREESRFQGGVPRFAQRRSRNVHEQAYRSGAGVPSVRAVDGPRARRSEHLRSGGRPDDANLRLPKLQHDGHEADTAGAMTVSESAGDGVSSKRPSIEHPSGEHLSSEHLSSEHLSGEHRRALAMLAGAPGGCTELLLRAQGFRPDFVSQLVRAGFAAARPGLVRGSGARSTGIIVVTITAKGREAITGTGCSASPPGPHAL